MVEAAPEDLWPRRRYPSSWMRAAVTTLSRRRLVVVVVVVLVLVAAACGSSGETGDRAVSSSTSVPRSSAPSVPVPTTQPCHPASLGVRAATVLVVGIGNATSADDPLAVEVSALGVGGVVLLGPNVVDAAQTRTLIEGLRQRAPQGLLVSVDEEGGRVSRLRPIVGPTPSARALGGRSPAEITAAAVERGGALDDLGFDLILAPVVDADGGPAAAAIGDRAFAATPAEAGRGAAAFAEGLHQSGVAAVAKHFPGQGELGDSHDGPVVFDAPLDDVAAVASAGFGPVLDAGASAVMMSHVTYPALGPLPASVEPAAYRLLRSLGFDGVAVTDAVNMSAVSEQWSLPEAAVMALAAGADLVLATAPRPPASGPRKPAESAVWWGQNGSGVGGRAGRGGRVGPRRAPFSPTVPRPSTPAGTRGSRRRPGRGRRGRRDGVPARSPR